MRFVRSGQWGWMAIGAFVLAYDALAIIHEGETLSEAHRRAHGNPWSRVAVLGAHAIVVAHLYDLLPRQADPFKWLGKGLSLARRS